MSQEFSVAAESLALRVRELGRNDVDPAGGDDILLLLHSRPLGLEKKTPV